MEDKKQTEPDYQILLNQLYPNIAPECLDNSNVFNLLSEQMSFKVNDLLSLKEITKYVTDKSILLNCLKQCDFLKISENEETATYDLPEGYTVFQILNFPAKMQRQEVEKSIELDNLSFSRLYKKSLYWILATNDKETVICSQNSLRELIIEDTKVKYDMRNKTQVLKTIKDMLEKNAYQKEAKNLGVKKTERKSSGNEGNELKGWRRGSGDNKSSFNSNNNNGNNDHDKQGFKNKKKDFKRSRFNSDNAPSRFQRGTAPTKEKEVEEIEIDISNLKYQMNIKYKYSFQDMKQYLGKLMEQNFFEKSPTFLIKENEIFANNKKDISVLDSLIQKFEKTEVNKIQPPPIIEDPKIKEQTNLNIPKMNPLCSMPKMFNKFDMIPGNIPQWNSNDPSYQKK